MLFFCSDISVGKKFKNKNSFVEKFKQFKKITTQFYSQSFKGGITIRGGLGKWCYNEDTSEFHISKTSTFWLHVVKNTLYISRT